MPHKILLLTAGATMDEIAANHGDFPDWFAASVKDDVDWTVCRVHDGEQVPPLQLFDGMMVTGSPASCTAWEPFMDTLCEAIRHAHDLGLPTLGVCFGHQIIATALGGRVTRNPAGREIGTVEVVLTTDGMQDPVLGPLLPAFRVQATHVDTVIEPPPGAQLLARTALDGCAAMRLDRHVYTVQFHPEITAPVMRRYISHRAKVIDGERGPGMADRLRATVQDTTAGEAIFHRFIQEIVVPYVRARDSGARPVPARVRSLRRRADHQEHTVPAADGQPIHCSEIGRGRPPLMMLDGLGCDGYVWKYLIDQLRHQHHVLRYHYAGHGRSAVPRGWPNEPSHRLTMQGCADDAVRVMDHLGVERAVLFGHSMGVQVALETFNRHPDRVMGLVLVCGSYGTPLRTFHGGNIMERLVPAIQSAFNARPSVTRMVWRTLLRTELAFQIAMRFEVNNRLIKRQDLEPYFDHLARVDPLLFVEMVRHAGAHSAEAFLSRINVPTLIVAAEHDSFTPAHLSEQMHRSIPNSELLHIPTGTHTAPIELPELLGLRVEKFLRTRLGGVTPAPTVLPVASNGTALAG